MALNCSDSNLEGVPSSQLSQGIDTSVQDPRRPINCSIESDVATERPAASRASENGAVSVSTTVDSAATSSSSTAVAAAAAAAAITAIHHHPESKTETIPSNLSKNRKKKLEKRERARQKKLERKAAEKAKRLADAIAEGRDLSEERRFVAERTRSGDRQRHLDEIWNAKRREAKEEGRFEICIDLGTRNKGEDKNGKDKMRIRAVFEQVMREREIASLAQQIRYCYSYNKKSPNPVFASVTGLTMAREIPTGENENDLSSDDYPTLRELLERETGFPEWNRRMFECTENTLEEQYGLVKFDENQPEDGAREKKIVYLTSDSSNTLEQLEEGTVYVIGGIVDRNRLKRATIDRAENELKVETAKLPLQEYLLANSISMTTTKVLTVNHVFDILLKYRQHGNDWNKAFREVLPSRKV